MLKLKVLVVVGVLAGFAVFGAMLAHGSWWWNSKIDIEGVVLQTIWEVTDDGENVYYYNSDFKVLHPKFADVEIIEQSANETVTLVKRGRLKCTSEGVQVTVKGKVNALPGATGTQAKVTLTADGVVVSEKTGNVGNWIVQKKVLLPTTTASC